MNFNSRYESFKDILPPYVLKRIAKEIEKSYNINHASSYIDNIFDKHHTQYLKKRSYDKQYFASQIQKARKIYVLEQESEQLKQILKY